MISEDDTKRLAVLEAAFQAFTSYGYKRTTMDDIARAAGMSRPAVYQHFPNKEAIFRTYAELFRDRHLAEAGERLRAAPSLAEALTAAFETAFLEPHRVLARTAHGTELLELKTTVAPDLFAGWLSGMEEILAQWLAHEARLGAVNLRGNTAGAYARLLVSAVEGIKTRNSDMDRAADELGLLAAMASSALSP